MKSEAKAKDNRGGRREGAEGCQNMASQPLRYAFAYRKRAAKR